MNSNTNTKAKGSKSKLTEGPTPPAGEKHIGLNPALPFSNQPRILMLTKKPSASKYVSEILFPSTTILTTRPKVSR